MFKVYQNCFHGGNLIKNHTSLKAALKTALKHKCASCTCGGPTIEKNDIKLDEIFIAYDYYHHNQGLTKLESIDLACKNYLQFN